MSTLKTTPRRPISSLVSLSIEYVAKNVFSYAGYLKFLPPYMKEKILQRLVRKSTFSGNLEFNKILEELIHPNLKCIDFSSISVNDDTLNAMNVCSMLTDLNLRNFGIHEYTSEGLTKLFEQMPKLLVLDISHCEKFNDCVLETLSIHCTNISELHCEGCNITDNGIIALAQHNSVIKCLTISNTDVTGKGISEAIKDENWPYLHELRLDNCTKVDDNVLKMVIENCPKIEILTFYNCAITDQTTIFQDITNTCKKLKQLYWTISW
ncbi:hypothetical protein Zmor_011703 [Zophobas morio]|uniref:F-box/LRR-repeat protein 15-like leucin rich repeat domain-containing protein n=1 Tax=Zophobas morio TaxID=2755281 RepID=A0AA38IMJ4_9CUCU|nr:hypothetical protein Zmor_011703 [Zophobas morio]